MSYFPLPNLAVGTSAYTPYTNWQGSAAAHSTKNQFDIKIDHRFSDRDLLSGRFSRDWGGSAPLNCFGNVADPCDYGQTGGPTHSVAINHTHTFSPTLMLNVTYGLLRAFGPGGEGIFNEAKYKGMSPSATLGLPTYLDTSGFPQLPFVSIGNYTPAGGSSDNIGTQPWSYLREGQQVHHLVGTLSGTRAHMTSNSARKAGCIKSTMSSRY
ncbi:MAG TPA: hypothetical protein VFF64_18195 [Candidatus Eremiobacteraceae bacterium]|nr:hypothetical protein [Candidatus Eremiobacteraceae bacterium]